MRLYFTAAVVYAMDLVVKKLAWSVTRSPIGWSPRSRTHKLRFKAGSATTPWHSLSSSSTSSVAIFDPWHPSGIMGRASKRLTSFCLNRAAVATRVITRSPRVGSKTTLSAAMVETGHIKSPMDGEKSSSTGAKQGTVLGRRIMILVDSKPEAKGALQWALSHAVQSHDTVVLLDVMKPKHGNRSRNELNPRRYELLYAMKNMCQARRPEIKVEVSLVEGKERGPTIVEEARKQEISLLVLGQRKRSATWRLVMMWAGNRVRGGGVVDYCIQNASCMALAVRRKSRRAGGGYLITSRRHKDFWLLA